MGYSNSDNNNKNLYLDNKYNKETNIKYYYKIYKKKNNVYKKNYIKTKREKVLLKYLNAIYI